jgi:NAD-dependent dihydropyrimidine dehydrogenase PreA subunit
MPTVKIEDKGCRGCTLCVDICPTKVFDFEEKTQLAIVARTVDCIGCFSCFYLCPSQCVAIEDVELNRPFHRVEKNVALVEKFLQEKSATRTIEKKDWDEAERDVGMTIQSLSKAISEMVGRGGKALGRKCGSAAASHLPEVYEETSLDGVLAKLQERFKSSIGFECTAAPDKTVTFAFKPCGLAKVVEAAGEKVGVSVVCQIFHDYMAGLLGAYQGVNYTQEAQPGPSCVLKLTAQT